MSNKKKKISPPGYMFFMLMLDLMLFFMWWGLLKLGGYLVIHKSLPQDDWIYGFFAKAYYWLGFRNSFFVFLCIAVLHIAILMFSTGIKAKESNNKIKEEYERLKRSRKAR